MGALFVASCDLFFSFSRCAEMHPSKMHLHQNLSHINSSTNVTPQCSLFTTNPIIFTAFMVIHSALLLPISVIVLYLGLQSCFKQWFASIPVSMRQPASFIYHMAAMEFIDVPGCFLMSYSMHQKDVTILFFGYSMWSFAWYGQTLIYLLTCTEHYLAVVHPVTYRNTQKECRIRIKNIVVGCVWLFVIAKGMCLKFDRFWSDLFIMTFLLISLCFSFLSILWVLTHSVVGEQGTKKRLSQSKKRAFIYIIIIQGTLLTRCVLGLGLVSLGKNNVDCWPIFYAVWLNLPCSVALPLFFLQQIGMLSRCNNNTRNNNG